MDQGFQGTFMAGTEGYTAPEILDETRRVGSTIDYGTDPHKVDVFSLGVLMFICVVKAPPFGLGPGASANVLKGNYQMHPGGWGRVPSAAKNLVKGMLAHKQDDRFTIEDVLEDSWIVDTKHSTSAEEKKGP